MSYLNKEPRENLVPPTKGREMMSLFYTLAGVALVMGGAAMGDHALGTMMDVGAGLVAFRNGWDAITNTWEVLFPEDNTPRREHLKDLLAHLVPVATIMGTYAALN